MKKEIIITILVGLVISLLVTVGIYRVRQAMTMPNRIALPTPTLQPSADPNQKPEESSQISLVSPTDGSIQEEPEVIVTGTATANSPLILLVGDKEYLSTSDSVGHFSFEVQLPAGPSVLTIYVINADGTTASLRRTVFMGDYFASPKPSATKE